MEIVAEIQARWDARARDAAIQFMSSGNREPPFGKNADNYWDFRGIRLDRALRIEGRTLQACDFSEATVNFFFEDCVLTDLRFHNADGRLSICLLYTSRCV